MFNKWFNSCLTNALTRSWGSEQMQIESSESESYEVHFGGCQNWPKFGIKGWWFQAKTANVDTYLEEHDHHDDDDDVSQLIHLIYMYIYTYIFYMLGDVLREVLRSSCFSPRYSRALFGLDRVDALALASKECEWPSRSLFQKASVTACANKHQGLLNVPF